MSYNTESTAALIERVRALDKQKRLSADEIIETIHAARELAERLALREQQIEQMRELILDEPSHDDESLIALKQKFDALFPPAPQDREAT